MAKHPPLRSLSFQPSDKSGDLSLLLFLRKGKYCFPEATTLSAVRINKRREIFV